MRRGRVALAVLFVAGSLVFAPAAAATPQHALPGITDCKDEPVAEVPGRGITGFFESAPKVPPTAADPFVDDATTSIYEQYGYAGLRWDTYDLGCGPDLARAPDAAIGTAVANWIFMLPKAAVAATGAILGAAFAPDFLQVFDPLVIQVSTALKAAVWDRWYVLVVAALGVFIIWRARKQAMNATATAIGWALLVMVLVTAIGRWPLLAGHAANESVTSVLSATASGLNGKAAGGQGDAATEMTSGLQESLLYQAWLGGTFGDPSSQVAKQYGPVIFKATALNWSEAKTLQDDPDGAGKTLLEAKQQTFKDAAEKVKDADPDAYDYLTGRRSDTRVGYAVLAALATLCAVPFLLVAGLLVLGALIIVRFGVMLFPAFATLGLFPTMRHLVTSIGSTCAAALLNAFVYGIGASVTVLGIGSILAVVEEPWLQVVLMLLVTVIMWTALKPFRRLTQMASGRDSFKDAAGGPAAAAKSAAGSVWRLGRALAGGAVAGAVAGEIAKDEIRDGQLPQRAEAQPADVPPIIHPPAILPPQPEFGSPPPVVIVTSARDLPAPAQPAIRSGRHAVEPALPEQAPEPDVLPTRAEAAEPHYDWDRGEADLAATPEETR